MSPFAILLCYFVFVTVTAGSDASVCHKRTGTFYNTEDHVRLFKEFLKEYKKNYIGEEFNRRLKIFKEQLHEINELNKQSHTAVYAINFFSDLTKEEYQKYLGLKVVSDPKTICKTVQYKNSTAVPEELDYREKKVVTDVKNQGSCGSCYAFSTIGVIEAQYAMKHGSLLKFSEQQIVDCNKDNFGCRGGFMTIAFTYISSEGLQLESDYPYTSVEGKCNHDASKSKVKVKSCSDLIIDNEEDIKNALNEFGPLAIGLDARAIKHYSGGILKKCPYINVNHALLLVGYGTENGEPFWLIKNSWGPVWGEKGYVRIARGSKMCGIGAMINAAVIE